MLHRKYLLGVLALGLGLSSCYNKDFNEPGRISIDRKPTERVIPASYDRTWSAVQAIFARFPIERRDADMASNRAFLVTDWVSGKSDVLYRGFDVNRVPFTIRYKLYVYVSGGGSGGATKVTINNVEQYRDDVITAGVDIDGSLMTWIRTESSTLKEARLLEEIQRLATDPGFSAQ